MPSLRFENPELQARFVEGVKLLPVHLSIDAAGTVVCTDEEWPRVNAVAHLIRNACFQWYFSWRNTPDDEQALEQHLKTNGLRYEVEHHDDRRVFLLPVGDKAKHAIGVEPGPERCSFCGRSLERQQFFAARAVAICDQCVKALHAEFQRDSKQQP